jgi:hypothetical protein
MRAAVAAKQKKSAPPTIIVPPMLHGRWIRFRMLTGDTIATLRAQLEADDLPVPSDAVLDAMRAALEVPKGFKPTNRKHHASQIFILTKGFGPMFQMPDRVERALVILRAPRMREIVEAGLLLGVPHSAIVSSLAACLKVTNVEAATLQMFASAFFDLGGVS